MDSRLRGNDPANTAPSPLQLSSGESPDPRHHLHKTSNQFRALPGMQPRARLVAAFREGRGIGSRSCASGDVDPGFRRMTAEGETGRCSPDRSREGGNPFMVEREASWVPAFAGMTSWVGMTPWMDR